MGAPLSMDLRQRILDAHLTREESWGELAKRFRVGVATVDRLIGRWKRTGSIAPKRPGPRPFFRIPDSQLGKVKRLLDAAPDSTTQEIADAYAKQTGVRVSRATMGRAFRRLGYTRKKSHSSPPSGGWRRIAGPAGGIWLRPPN
ncbi:transposase [Corallococcus praedator]|uniref:Transposase n=2 Tax=Myxococcaceae TaxID=31 RepID=A0ABX9Q657_9BACT|nr:transposase [Corallococcus exiguus]RKG95453.1 transposase [Corallococcus sp. CA047B]RKH15776.1 transposase [Corallococcus sp. CA031C]RKH88131.1 transposase [Corallococcus praedator]RKH98178.1 transposase [Corallococcus sp. AB038B]